MFLRVSVLPSNDALLYCVSELLCIFFSLQQADETLDFEEQILEAAKSIAAATSALVKSASAAQRELVAQGKVSQHDEAPTICKTCQL